MPPVLRPPRTSSPASGRRLRVAIAAVLVVMALGPGAASRAHADGLGITVIMRSDPQIGVPFALQMAAHGGVPPYAWTLVDGALPAGLTLLADGTVSGVPVSSDDPSTFTVRVQDAVGNTVEHTITIHAGRWKPDIEGIAPSVDAACSAAGEGALRASLEHLCERFRDPVSSDLARWIIGMTLQRMREYPGWFWYP